MATFRGRSEYCCSSPLVVPRRLSSRAGSHIRLGQRRGRTASPCCGVAAPSGGPDDTRTAGGGHARRLTAPKPFQLLALIRGGKSPPGEPSTRAGRHHQRGKTSSLPPTGEESSDIHPGFRERATLSAGRGAIEEWLDRVHHLGPRPRIGAVRRRSLRRLLRREDLRGHLFLARSPFNSDCVRFVAET